MFNRGIFNEYDIVSYLNGRRVCMLSKNWRYILECMFGVLSPLMKIKAGKMDKFIKPDIYIEYKGVRKYISIKSGRATHLHTEQIETLMNFCRQEGISENTIKIIKLFIYGDGTLDGTGKVRFDYYEVYDKYKKYIDAANKELNADKEFVIKFLLRILFQGVDPKEPMVDYIFFGHADLGGEIISREKIIGYIRHKPSNNWDFKHTIHIGPISLRPHARYAHTEVRNEESRHKINCQWDDFLADLIYIIKRYGN